MSANRYFIGGAGNYNLTDVENSVPSANYCSESQNEDAVMKGNAKLSKTASADRDVLLKDTAAGERAAERQSAGATVRDVDAV